MSQLSRVEVVLLDDPEILLVRRSDRLAVPERRKPTRTKVLRHP